MRWKIRRSPPGKDGGSEAETAPEGPPAPVGARNSRRAPVEPGEALARAAEGHGAPDRGVTDDAGRKEHRSRRARQKTAPKRAVEGILG